MLLEYDAVINDVILVLLVHDVIKYSAISLFSPADKVSWAIAIVNVCMYVTFVLGNPKAVASSISAKLYVCIERVDL